MSEGAEGGRRETSLCPLSSSKIEERGGQTHPPQLPEEISYDDMFVEKERLLFLSNVRDDKRRRHFDSYYSGYFARDERLSQYSNMSNTKND